MNAPKQIDRTAVLDLVYAIASRHLLLRPGEEAFFRAAGPALIDSYLDEGPTAFECQLRTNAFEWGPTVPADLAWLPVLLGTLKAGLELWKSIGSKPPKSTGTQEVLDKWKQRLIESGLDPAVAGTIASEMGSDFAKVARD
jgi:hypothetical protein